MVAISRRHFPSSGATIWVQSLTNNKVVNRQLIPLPLVTTHQKSILSAPNQVVSPLPHVLSLSVRNPSLTSISPSIHVPTGSLPPVFPNPSKRSSSVPRLAQTSPSSSSGKQRTQSSQIRLAHPILHPSNTTTPAKRPFSLSRILSSPRRHSSPKKVRFSSDTSLTPTKLPIVEENLPSLALNSSPLDN